MNPHFDLLEERWIPCIRRDGRPDEMGLLGVLAQAHELLELSGESPLVVAALYRLLLAVLHRVFGPKDANAWSALWQAGRWDARRLADYLERYRERFHLFHPQHPFYQAKDTRVQPKSVASMVHHVASGNNATLFDHHTDRQGMTLTPAQAARLLVAAQTFGLAGLSGLPQKFTDGPCARGVIFLVQGESLFETLALNLLPYPDDAILPTRPDDCPAWEMDDPFKPERAQPRGYLDYLTWQNRRILLIPEETPQGTVVREMTMAPGLRLDATVLDPMKHYTKDPKRGPLPLRFDENRALWRDSAALFRLRVEGHRPPRALYWLAELVWKGHLPIARSRRTMALGMSNSQAKVEFYRGEQLPLPLEYLQDERLVDALEMALKMAEDVSRQLWGATRQLAIFLLAPEADQPEARQPSPGDLNQVMEPWNVERRYWSQLEIPFRSTVEALPKGCDDALAGWRQTLRRAAWEAFEGAVQNLGTSPRALKAEIRARDQLAVGLARVLPAAADV